MTISLGIVMDPIGAITIYKDSSFAMLLEAQARGWTLYYMEQGDLYLEGGQVQASMRRLQVRDKSDDWFELGPREDRALTQLDTVLMRKDPPLNMEFIYTTYLLEKAAEDGCLVVNRPDSIRNANEKLFTAWFPECAPPTLVSRDMARIKGFLQSEGDIILKPLDGMGGSMIFRLTLGDPNTSVILETMTDLGRRTVMAQRFLPDYVKGDKRILMIDGEPVPYALARIPAQGEARANLAAGGTGVGVALSERDRWICQQVGPSLRERGLMFVGLDVIGDYLTEINVTSPTCIRELDSLYDLNISAQLMDCIQTRITS